MKQASFQPNPKGKGIQSPRTAYFYALATLARLEREQAYCISLLNVAGFPLKNARSGVWVVEVPAGPGLA